jgi:hypothetical protein
MVEVQFKNGSIERGLIASPNLIRSKELRMFSFNVAISRQPIIIKLYRFTTKKYPNLQASSTKDLLYTRNVTSILAGASLSSKNPTLPQVVKAGRGWLGSSGDVPITQFCFTPAECRNVQSEIIWRGVEGKNIRFFGTLFHK